ncbi:predicted protein [Aspergillus terreus NIH2624]|uniref:HNH nuclease domain-containing protein n=1 Tax=Aspergillus terreus (strain NIH 2624 / FGSC A1156) TaxID=341663 RepID=Q0CEY0_ASPTN|nr:uncharacterized protein ATEG_07754 [Aspergillus terreus NIH2624]EAU32016.1 predicted protein [Aspergillus terreus NIH2624]
MVHIWFDTSPMLGTIVMNLEATAPNRNVHLFDGHGKYLAGMRIRTEDRYVTNSNLYSMSAIVLDLEDAGSSSPRWAIYRLAKSSRTKNTWSVKRMLPRDNQYVDVGNYAVLTTNASYLRVQQTPEKAMHRCVSPEGKTDPNSLHTKFRDKVRDRDGACMITGTPHPEGEDWGGYESTHIWPLAREGTWNATPQLHGWITDTAPAAEIGGSRLFSPQNGILMKSDLHTRFIVYKFSINPDDGYKVTYFGQDVERIGGRRLQRNALDPANPQHRVSDGLLRWHFRQAVLKNMKGVPDVWPDWEFDLAGESLLEIIKRGPDAEERMELELFGRLAGWEEVSNET